MARIERINDWLLGQATVEPPVEVFNTQYRAWEPDADGSYPVQALYYSVMVPHVMRRDADLQDRDPQRDVTVHNRSILATYLVADMASRTHVIDADGNPIGPLSLEQVDDPKLGDLGLHLDTATLRRETSEFYSRIGGVTVAWIDEPPIVPIPLTTEQFFPDGHPGQG